MTGYRDDLQAAQARIALLEAELDALREGHASATPRGGRRLDGEAASPVGPVRARMDEYKQRLAAAEQRVADLERQLTSTHAMHEQELASTREALAREEARLGAMPTVTAYNRARPPDDRGEPAGVLCTLCLLTGSKVEMHLVDATARCPRCRFTHPLASSTR